VKRILTASEMRAVDAASADLGMPAAVLMENAGQALAAAALALGSPRGRFLVLCGPGNNGGDGLVAARVLAMRGRAVSVELVAEPQKLTGEAERNWRALAASGVKAAPISGTDAVGEGDVVIDALLGTGLSRAPEGRLAAAIERIDAFRAKGARVLAADVPSGLHSDSGEAFSPCVTADATACFGFLKVGQLVEPGASNCGVVDVVDIGIPEAALGRLSAPAVALLEEADVRHRLARRRPADHKGTFGHVLLVAGSGGKTGAAALAGMGALRAGAGLVTIASRPEAVRSALQHHPELMGIDLGSDGPLGMSDLDGLLRAAEGKTAIVIGPGLPRGEETGALIVRLVSELAMAVLIDADGLNAMGARPELLSASKAPVVLTPHPGEMARLLARTSGEVQAARLAAARALAARAKAVAVLKGAKTVIARPDGTAFVNPTGNAGMATGGTGDVLAGVCGALLARGMPPSDAAMVAAYVHGLAGDVVARRTGETGLVASDLLAGLQEVWARWDL
jgi:ADP-dependent NAD(P)H-hydrate dehydratase / NAD(P)H-hydrate epimerase